MAKDINRPTGEDVFNYNPLSLPSNTAIQIQGNQIEKHKPVTKKMVSLISNNANKLFISNSSKRFDGFITS